MSILVYGVLIVTYLGIGLGYLPKLRMNRATIALVGATLLIALGVLTLDQAWQSIDPDTIVFLLSMMVVNAGLSYAGVFQFVLSGLVKLTHSPFGLLVVLVFGSGGLSAFLLNDTLALVCTPLTLQVCQTLNLNPIPYLLALACATNIGSVATLSGNPQNILIGSFSGISYGAFAQAMTPIAIVGLILEVVLLWLYYPEVRSVQPFKIAPNYSVKTFRPLLIKSLLITSLLFLAFIIGLPLAESALVAAAAFLVTRRLKPEKFLKEIDWNLLVLFCCLFILTRAIRSLNLLAFFENMIHNPWGLISSVSILSNLISNVPTVLLLHPLIAENDTTSWLLLAATSTLAGNLTLFGAVANLITVNAAIQNGYSLDFFTHMRFGIPLTIGTLIISYGFLYH